MLLSSISLAENCHPEHPQSYIVEDVQCEEGVPTWKISNEQYFKKSKKNRAVASVEENNQEEIETNKSPEKKPSQSLYLSLYAGSASIASTDTVTNARETAVSDIGYGASLSWTHAWSKKASFFAVGSIRKFQFKVASNRTLSDSSISHSYVGAGVNYKLSDRFSIAPGLGVGESLVLSSNGGTNLEIEKISIPAASVSTQTKIYTFDSGYSLDLKARVGALIPTNQRGFKSELGYYYNIGLGSNYNLWGKKLHIDFSYTNRSLDIGNAEQTSKDLGITTGFGWSF